jgi:hypothetical protein
VACQLSPAEVRQVLALRWAGVIVMIL